MICPKCKIAMKEEKRIFHKQRKWICHKCKKVRFQSFTQDNKFQKQNE